MQRLKFDSDMHNVTDSAAVTAGEGDTQSDRPKAARKRSESKKRRDNVVSLNKRSAQEDAPAAPKKKATRKTKKVDAVQANPVDAAQPAAQFATDAAQDVPTQALDFPYEVKLVDADKVYVAASAAAGHKHVHGESCTYCDLDEAKVTAAYQALKAREAQRRKQTSELQSLRAEVAAKETTRPEFNVEVSPRHDSMKIIASVVTAAFVVFSAAVWLEHLNYVSGSSVSGATKDKSYTTVDGNQALNFEHGSLFITNRGVRNHVANVHKWQDNYRDQLGLLMGAFDNTLWLKSTPSGLESADGVTFYASDAPELNTIETMRAIKDGAKQMFLTQGRYPNDVAEISPFVAAASKMPHFSVTHEIGSNLVTQGGETSFEQKLNEGALFSQEKTHAPNSISCVEIKSEPMVSADLNSYGWRTDSFFIHAFDRNGKMLRTGTDNKDALLYVLKNGTESSKSAAQQTAKAVNKPASVTIFSGDIPNKFNIRLAYAGVLILFIVFAVLIYLGGVHRSAMEHLTGRNATS